MAVKMAGKRSNIPESGQLRRSRLGAKMLDVVANKAGLAL